MATTLARAAAAVGVSCAIVGVMAVRADAQQAAEGRSETKKAAASAASASTGKDGHRAVVQGMTIDFDVSQYGADGREDRALREGDNVEIGFTIRDAGSNSPVVGLNPSAWLALARPSGDDPRAGCGDLVRSALGQTVFSRPALDLNAFYVLALNADATITVVDPLFGFGGTKLLAMVALESQGEDWALTSDQNRLLVSMPAANRVAAIDTRSWSVVANVEIGPAPSRIALQPDEGYAWIAYQADETTGASSGVAVLDVRTLKVVARIATGRGPHQLAFTDDSRFAFVTNGDEGSVSIVDVRTLQKVKDVAVARQVASIAFSKLARAAYVTSPEAGTVTAIGVAKQDVIARIDAAPGLGAIEIAPDGRFGFAVNTGANTVTIFDTARNRVVKTADLEKGPDQIAFSSRYAYVRHRDSEIVVMMPLDALGTEGEKVALLDFPGGQHPLGSRSGASLAPSIVRSGEDNAVLVANPGDKAIYYYQEGMAAPMGQFSNYGREPRAVRVVDRSLRETRPGRYLSAASLPAAGRYNALLFINNPRVVHCFDLSIGPAVRKTTEELSTRVEPLTRETTVAPSTAITIRVRMIDVATGKPLSHLQDAGILVMAPGVWQTRQSLEHESGGVYVSTLAPPAPGLYTVFVACPSRQMPYRRVLAVEVAGENK